MAGIINADVGFMAMVAKGYSPSVIRKKYPYATVNIVREARKQMSNEIIEIPTGIQMIQELHSMLGEAKTFLRICKQKKDVANGLSSIRTIAKLSDSYAKIYDIASRAQERKESVTQIEFDEILGVLRTVLSKYPDVGAEFADALKNKGMVDKSEAFKPTWDEAEYSKIPE